MRYFVANLHDMQANLHNMQMKTNAHGNRLSQKVTPFKPMYDYL